MVHGDERRDVACHRQISIEPRQLCRVERAGILAGTRRVEHHQPHHAEVDRVVDRLTSNSRYSKVPVQRTAIVVIAGHHAERCLQWGEKLPHLVVFRIVR
jgi:uncharacterized protein YqfA (UPF0365 family)